MHFVGPGSEPTACGADQPMVISDSPSGVITSPNYPDSNYPENSDCTWHITAGVGETISISFTDFYVEQE